MDGFGPPRLRFVWKWMESTQKNVRNLKIQHNLVNTLKHLKSSENHKESNEEHQRQNYGKRKEYNEEYRKTTSEWLQEYQKEFFENVTNNEKNIKKKGQNKLTNTNGKKYSTPIATNNQTEVVWHVTSRHSTKINNRYQYQYT